LFGRLILYGALALALGIVIVSACGAPPQAAPSPTSTAFSSVTPTPASSPTGTVRPNPTATSAPTVAPTAGSTPAGACPRATGGGASNQAQLVALRVAHQPGFDRLVFEFGPSTAPGSFGMPAFTIETASSLSGPSGQPVAITGNSVFGVRFQNASTQNPSGGPSYTGSTDIRPATPLIKNVKLVEDFERVLVWGVGLDRLACPTVLQLTAPLRVVLDFPTPP
jgi:hypothetical protein